MIDELLAIEEVLKESEKISHSLLTLLNNYDSIVMAIETLAADNLTLDFVKTRQKLNIKIEN